MIGLTRSDPTTELMGPKKGNMMARNQMWRRAMARRYMLLLSCIPTTSHTKYSGVQAKPKVMNWWMSMRMTAASLHPDSGSSEKALEWDSSWSPKAWESSC
ncbi:hypothetical protein OPV22_021646 [Ensete ventricosum]|uniref:Uncharacterized protein n=1 Tax=Ensete ventricosum TaxID=4639 RepID=A0AAV8QDM4_ENSVE|nr:hypothetical protein OPV22_021646 [Ensete ventricosum]